MSCVSFQSYSPVMLAGCLSGFRVNGRKWREPNADSGLKAKAISAGRRLDCSDFQQELRRLGQHFSGHRDSHGGDRLLHRSNTINLKGECCRLKQGKADLPCQSGEERFDSFKQMIWLLW